MIEGLEQVLEGSRQPGVPELRCLLQELLGGRDVTGSFDRAARAQRKFTRYAACASSSMAGCAQWSPSA